MRLLSVSATNFRAYKSLEWDIPSNGLTLIDGANHETGRSNMTGKTTLLDSVFWGLYGFLPKWGGPKGGPADAVITRGETKCIVTVTLEREGKRIQVTRQRPNKLKLTIDGEEAHGKSSDLDTRIEQLTGMTPSQFLVSVYISQDRQNSFFTMSDNERTALLSVVAGLESLDRGLATAKQRRDTAQAQIERLSGGIAVLQEQLDLLPAEAGGLIERQEALERDISDMSSRYTLANEKYEQEVQSAEAKFQEEKVFLEGLLKQVDDSLAKDEKDTHQEILALRDTITDSKPDPKFIEAVALAQANLTHAEVYNEQVRFHEKENDKTRSKLQKELDAIENKGDENCSQCGQKYPHWDHEAEIQRHMEKAEELSNQLVEVGELMELPPLREALQNAQVALATHKAEIDAKPNQIKAEIRALEGQLKNIQSARRECLLKHDNQISRITNEKTTTTTKVRLEVNALSEQLKSLLSDKKGADEAVGKLLNKQTELESRLEEHNGKVSALNVEVSEALDLIEVFGPKGFRAICFDGLIDRIGSRAGQLLSVMTDGMYSTRLDQVGEDSKGQQKLILKPVITKGGLEVPNDDLSGGARRMAMLAYDVAVSEAVADGAPLLLDEALDGLDAMGKGEAMVLLEEVAKGRPVLVIDHASEFKTAFLNVIKVGHKSGVSFLESSNDFKQLDQAINT